MTNTRKPNYRPRTYLTGVRYTPIGQWWRDWTNATTAPESVTSWFATREQSEQVAAQLSADGMYSVELVTR